jgi:cobalamin biosynthesis protein CobD/CbiB
MVDRWKAWTHRLGDRLLYRFDKWFSSGAGVWQTLFVCLIVCVVEISWPDLDPHFFWLLMILTVYSAITQPALAQSGAATANELRKITLELKKIVEQQVVELEEEGEILDDVKQMLERMNDE